MLEIELICPGKTKENWLNIALGEYERRLTRFCKFSWRILKEHSKLPAEKCVEEESRRILETLKPGVPAVLLEPQGESWPSEKFADFLSKKAELGSTRLAFIIGGAYGVNTSVGNKVDLRLSLSPMTFTHQMCRLVFLEQLYRAFTIVHRIPYHH